jgi:hypothetical protein
MDEFKFFAGLTAISLAVIGLFIYFGRKLSKAADRHALEIDLPLYVTPTGTALFACIVAFWVVCVAARALKPESSFGSFLNGPEGVFAVISGSIFFAGIAAAILTHLGYPIANKEKNS